ncbi:MAG TPA: SURF1 family protein [Gammaproteobacteria bacterium]
MTNSIGRRLRFRPALAQSIASVVLFLLLLSLGNWQLHRAGEKQALFAAIDAALHAAAQPVSALQASSLPQRASAAGRYEQLPFLLDNRVRNGRAGYELLAPLQLADGRAVLVVLGWLPQGEDRAHLPSVTLPAGTVQLEGLALAPAAPPFALSEREAFASGWPKVVQTAVPAQLARVLGHSLLPLVIYPDGSEAALHELDALHAFPPARHRAYAAQWFVMAGVLLLLYLRHGLRRGAAS